MITPLKQILLTALICTTPHLHAQVVKETYEMESAGAGTYSGSWNFIYAEQVLGTTVSSLNIRNGPSYGGGDGSPTSGNYLEFQTATGSWAAEGAPYPVAIDNSYRYFTTDAWESPMGHFQRTEMLQAGATYEVSLWRKIVIKIDGVSSVAFSVWDGSSVNHVTPFLSTPDSLLTKQPYDTATGGWQQVSPTFTAPGAPGSVLVPVDFMMGTYAPSDVPANFFSFVPEMDGNPRTADTTLPGHGAFLRARYSQTQGLALADFILTPVPEPSFTLLGSIDALALGRRGRLA